MMDGIDVYSAAGEEPLRSWDRGGGRISRLSLKP